MQILEGFKSREVTIMLKPCNQHLALSKLCWGAAKRLHGDINSTHK